MNQVTVACFLPISLALQLHIVYVVIISYSASSPLFAIIRLIVTALREIAAMFSQNEQQFFETVLFK